MPLPYTGNKGESNFEADLVELLTKAGWEKEILKNKTVPELIDNWKNILFERNRRTLNNVPLSDDEMDRVLDVVKLQANTPVKANHFVNGRPLAVKRDLDSPDTQHAGHEVYLDLFSAAEIAGGSSRYQIAEQTYFSTDPQYNNRRGDVTLLINGMDTDNIIQAISRTNRVLNNNEKPWGMVKFYRKPYTMKRNLNEALKLYCQGDYAGVEVGNIDENIETLNKTYNRISDIFAHDNIEHFECLPHSNEDRQMFRKEFYQLKSTLRAAILQGFKWNNEYGTRVDFDEKTYRILTMRYKDLPSNRGGGGSTAKPGYVLDTDLSTMEMDKIDAAYLEAQFKIVTMKDIINVEKDAKKMAAIHEIETNLGILSEIQQRYARQILKDIKTGNLEVIEGKTFLQYIQEYQEKTIRSNIHAFADIFGIDEDEMFSLYVATRKCEVDVLRLDRLEATANKEKLKAYYNVPIFKAHVKLHQDLKEYIEGRKADNLEGVD